MTKLSIRPLRHYYPYPNEPASNRPGGPFNYPWTRTNLTTETTLYLSVVTQQKIKLMRSGSALGTGLWLGSLGTAFAGGSIQLEIFLMGGAFASTCGGWLIARAL